MKTNLLKVSLRQNAVFIPQKSIMDTRKEISPNTLAFLSNIKKLGYSVSEDLLHALEGVTPNDKMRIYDFLCEVTGAKLNWAPLVKGWDTPTCESYFDHLITAFANTLKINRGLRLSCGHLIPYNTFPLERYTGCPFCGTPFQMAGVENYGQGSKLKVLELWTEENVNRYFEDLLQSRTALDATQVDSLKLLTNELPIPNVAIEMKETMMVVIDSLVEKGDQEQVQTYFASPTDIMRYLWYKKTGFLQIINPRTIIDRVAKNNGHMLPCLDQSKRSGQHVKEALKLKYTRSECRMVATWLNNLNMPAQKACENMHPKREMWVRFIRALRLAEYAKKVGFERLRGLLDVFYNQTYEVWQGEVDQNRMKMDADKTFSLLKQRPGLFARSLFANMLWFGADQTLAAFAQIVDQLPARLVFTLSMYAQNYFNRAHKRNVKPLGGINKVIAANQLLILYTDDELDAMITKIEDLCLDVVSRRFAKLETNSKTMYIDPQLFNIPLAIGDRSETIQDMSCALMGTRFPIEGKAVRLFMQWGKGLPAQHLDMDLSCQIAYDGRVDSCSYFRLVTTGAKHSGDIRSIPNEKGTAEYIELNIDELQKAGATYVSFTCNAYSCGSLSPNLVVGWMNSAYPMKISEKTGVAYDPSCVQHQVRVTQGVSKGLVFGVLDVKAVEIIWLEMPFGGQVVGNLDVALIKSLINKLNSKITVGNVLKIKAEAQNIHLIDSRDADEMYTYQWALNTAAVTQLLVD